MPCRRRSTSSRRTSARNYPITSTSAWSGCAENTDRSVCPPPKRVEDRLQSVPLHMDATFDRLMFATMTFEANRGAARRSDDALESRAVAAVKSGDAAAYDYLVSKYMKRVVSIAWGFVRNAH